MAGTSFELTPEQQAAQDKAKEDELAAEQRINKDKDLVSAVKDSNDFRTAQQAGKKVGIDAQSQNAGVQRVDTETTAAGIAGFFGGKDTGSQYTAGTVQDQSYDANKAAIAAKEAEVTNRANAQMTGATVAPAAQIAGATIDQTQANNSLGLALAARGNDTSDRSQQQRLADALQAQAAGTGPSVAALQMQQATNANLRAALSQAASSRGISAGAAQRMAAENRTMATQQAAADSAISAIQEQRSGQDALGNQLGAMRSGDQSTRTTDLATRAQDLGVAGDQAALTQGAQTFNAGAINTNQLTQAQLDQSTGTTNLQANIDQQKQKDAIVSQLMANGMSLDQAQVQAQIQQTQFNADLMARQEAARQGNSMEASKSAGQATAATIGAIGTVAAAAASDRKLKTNVKRADGETEDFLNALVSYAFDYKNPDRDGAGRHLGVMAQDVESARPDIIVEMPQGKGLSTAKSLGAALASLGYLHRRVKKLESA